MKILKITNFFLGLMMSNLCMASPITSYDIVVAADGTGKFKTVQEAVNAVPDNQSKRTVIFIKTGVYKEKVTVPSTKKNLTLIGEDVVKTIIIYDDYSKKWNGKDTLNTFTSYSFSVEADGFMAENLTFENSAGRVGQAVAVRILADKVMFKNCRILGNQDTLFAHGIGRIYFSNCYIEGTTDFIFGSAIALFESCQVHSKKDSYITAASTPQGNTFGYIFKNCTLTADTGIHKVYLGRPWRAYAKTVYISCTMGSHICPEGWDNWRNPDKEKTAFYAEYKCTGPGSNTSARVTWSKQLTDAEAANYTMDQIFSRDSVPIPMVGSWNPSLK
jgi:pectinesterase